MATSSRSTVDGTFLPTTTDYSPMASEPATEGVASDRALTPGFGFFAT